MKEFCMIVGFGAGLVTGALLYKHSQDAKKLINKGEKTIKDEMENLKKNISNSSKQKEKQKEKQKSKA